jgi:Amt family ammonium transporter
MKRIITMLLLLTALSLWGFTSGLYAEEPAKPAAPAAEQAKAPEPAPAPAAPVNDPSGTKTGGVADLVGATPNAPTADDLKDLDKKQPLLFKIADVVGHNRIAINIMWTLITGFLVMFMQAGFAMVETGFCRAKNAAHTMAMNFMVYAIGVTGFLICGFAFMFGGSGSTANLGMVANLNHEYVIHLFGKDFGLIGLKGFFLGGESYDVSVFTLFLFQVVFMDTAATIPTGAMAERWKFFSFVVYGFFIAMVTYPIFGNWVWGGGWLSQLGTNFGLGHGAVDFAGSGVVHMVGGVTALVGAMVLGPRIGKYRKDGTPVAIPGHHIPMALIGTFILAFGWFGFNPGSTLAGTDLRIGIVAANTMIASAAGALAAMIVMYLKFGKPDPGMMANGMLAGLVAITAPCAFVDAKFAFLIGLIAGVLVVYSVLFVERKLKVDDPVGAISVHGTCGAWGVLALGLFADGKYGDGWNGVKGTVTGLLYGDASQLAAQVVDVVVLFIFVFTFSWLFFKVLDKIVGNRVAPEVELEGLDVPEVGVSAYPDFVVAKTPSEM